jgi:hypothetical protein
MEASTHCNRLFNDNASLTEVVYKKLDPLQVDGWEE